MHTCELIEINCGIVHVLYTATSRQDLYRAYRAASQRGGLVRMRIDGKTMRIYQAVGYAPAETRGGRKCPN